VVLLVEHCAVTLSAHMQYPSEKEVVFVILKLTTFTLGCEFKPDIHLDVAIIITLHLETLVQ